MKRAEGRGLWAEGLHLQTKPEMPQSAVKAELGSPGPGPPVSSPDVRPDVPVKVCEDVVEAHHTIKQLCRRQGQGR